MERQRIHVKVFGRVQGVAFREYTRREAVRLGLSGWVRNLADGSVEVEFEGPAEKVPQLLEWLTSTGSPYSQVTRIESSDLPPTKNTEPFLIR